MFWKPMKSERHFWLKISVNKTKNQNPKHTSWPGSCPTVMIKIALSLYFYFQTILFNQNIKSICDYFHAPGIETLLIKSLSGGALNFSGGDVCCFFDLFGSIDSTRRQNHYTNTFGCLCRILKFLSFQAFDIFQNLKNSWDLWFMNLNSWSRCWNAI